MKLIELAKECSAEIAQGWMDRLKGDPLAEAVRCPLHDQPPMCTECIKEEVPIILKALNRAVEEEREKRIVHDECLLLVRDMLMAQGCRHSNSHNDSTPPMFFPEWIGCVVGKREDRIQELSEALRTCQAALGQLRFKFDDDPEACAFIDQVLGSTDQESCQG